MNLRPTLLALSLALAVPSVSAEEVAVRVLAINDFHGQLQAEPAALAHGAPPEPAGGAVALAATLARLRAGHPNSVLVSAGDLIGASPLASALAQDEPTLQLFKQLDLQANAIGNHELDAGLARLRQQQDRYLHFVSANLVDSATGEAAFAPFRMVNAGGARIAFVGVTPRNALAPLEPAAVPGLRVDDEAEAVNQLVPFLREVGTRAVVVLLHEGATPAAGAAVGADCSGLAGPARDIAAKLDPEVDLVLSAHTHQVYACRLGGRGFAQAGSGGSHVTVADLVVDTVSGEVRLLELRNEPVRADVPADAAPEVAKLVDAAVAAAAKVARASVGALPVEGISATPDDEGGSPLGRLVAHAQLAAGRAQGAQLACTNPSSVPRDLVAAKPGEPATYADVRAAQPYGNRLKLRRVTGAQLRKLLEQQWRTDAEPVMLSCSPGLSYRLDDGHRVEDLRLDGQPVADTDTLTMVANSYLARGGEGFGALVDTPEVGEAGLDYDALINWLRAPK